MIKNKVTIIGLGYVGLPLLCCIAKNTKFQVCGFDLDQGKIKKIEKRICPIDDEKTANYLKGAVVEVSHDSKIIKGSEFIVICVPTPVKNNKMPDLKPVISAIKIVSKYLERRQKIILESTVNPGVCEEIILPILEKTGLKGGKDFELSHCPERINPGDTKWFIENIPRNVGSLTKVGNKIVANFYRSFIKSNINEVSSLKVAESSKIIENTFRDVNIAYVNELAKSFDAMGIDLLEVIKAASNKPFAFLPHYPGCGVGGHCIPVDPYYLIKRAKESGFDHSFLKKARSINNSMPKYTVDILLERLPMIGKNVKQVIVGVLGLAYKPDVADLRESAALKIVQILKTCKACIVKYDPCFKKLSDASDLEDFLKKVDVVIVATSHRQFLKLSSKDFKKHGIKIIIDGRNCLDKDELIRGGLIYKGIGH